MRSKARFYCRPLEYIIHPSGGPRRCSPAGPSPLPHPPAAIRPVALRTACSGPASPGAATPLRVIKYKMRTRSPVHPALGVSPTLPILCASGACFAKDGRCGKNRVRIRCVGTDK
jgi:hypothetical protein